MTASEAERHVADIWEDVADRIGDRPALIHAGKTTNWRDFELRAARLAAALAAAGVGVGSKVAIDLYNCSEWLEAFFATIKLRAMPANVNYRYLDDELVHLLTDSGAEALIFHASLADRIGQLRASLPNVKIFVQVADESGIAPGDGIADYEALIASYAPAPRLMARDPHDSYLSYTGGTTGLPKGVMVSFARLAASMPMLSAMLDLTPEEAADPVGTAVTRAASGRPLVALPASPLMHSTAFTMTAVPTLNYGGTVVTLASRSFDPHEACASVERHGVHLMAIVGDAIGRPLYRALDEKAASGAPYDMSSLRLISSAGVAWSADTKRGLFEHLPGVVLLDACGATEGTTYGIKLYRKGDDLSGTNFMPAPGLRLGDEAGHWQPAAPGVTGIMANRTASTGYYNDPEKSARTFFMLEGEQYAVPGDYGRIEADGSLTLIGRKSSVINTGGEKVHAEEVEHVIRAMAAVDDCLVFGMPDERFGQRVTALVQPGPGAVVPVPEILAHARARLAGYKVPKQIFFVPQVPRGPNGKPDYSAAREIVAALHLRAGA